MKTRMAKAPRVNSFLLNAWILCRACLQEIHSPLEGSRVSCARRCSISTFDVEPGPSLRVLITINKVDLRIKNTNTCKLQGLLVSVSRFPD
jgi:hypothetical protein